MRPAIQWLLVQMVSRVGCPPVNETTARAQLVEWPAAELISHHADLGALLRAARGMMPRELLRISAGRSLVLGNLFLGGHAAYTLFADASNVPAWASLAVLLLAAWAAHYAAKHTEPRWRRFRQGTRRLEHDYIVACFAMTARGFMWAPWADDEDEPKGAT